MRKFLVCLSILSVIFVYTTKAEAIMLFDDRTAWEAAVGGAFSEADIAGQLADFGVLTAGSPLALPLGQSLSFDTALSRRQVPGSWGTWSGGQTPAVLYTQGAISVDGTFGGGAVSAFGLEMEPNPFSFHDMTLALSDGSELTLSVNGASGARFFGFTEGSITGLTLSSDTDFAFGRIVISGEEGSGDPVIPEPTTMLLFGTGLVGAYVRKRRRS